jgi:hypothetical protein
MIAEDTIEHQHTFGAPPQEALPPRGYNEPSLVDTARAWMEANETVAILGAFAAGVFLGVLMRR